MAWIQVDERLFPSTNVEVVWMTGRLGGREGEGRLGVWLLLVSSSSSSYDRLGFEPGRL